MGAYISTQHSTTGISLLMMLTLQEKGFLLTFFYAEGLCKGSDPTSAGAKGVM